MARAKFDNLKNTQSKENFTHKDLQKQKAGRPLGSKVKKEQSNASLTIALTPSQKKQLEEYANLEYRSVGSVIKMLLIKNDIIKINE
ncbi:MULTISPECIES: hypothetical protein [Arcobacteraceae]|uniref:Uncharacterized protein n=1 Tax=Poseidonibacter parvus TaxID=1850254 RepID=A0A1P8KP66_9BACT|nr:MULTISPECIES: hypothetical protein [Arcobacteraceae]APW66338.1 hypothetical protein LPB137_11005 [Poseidonibacter parvus]